MEIFLIIIFIQAALKAKIVEQLAILSQPQVATQLKTQWLAIVTAQ
jgi:hypothetical protein